MIWFIIGFIVAVIIIIHGCCDEWYGFWTKIGCSVMSLLLCLSIGAFGVVLTSRIIGVCVDIEYNDMVSDKKIVALKDNQGISGSFYIMGGYVDEDLYYYYAVETELGYKTEKIKADNVYIKYTDGETHIEEYAGDFANKNLYLWGVPMCDHRYIVYCPEGTITNEFNVDLE